MAAIKYGEDDWPYLKEALRFYIENNESCHYHYRELLLLFKTEPCIICSSISYKDFEREQGKLLCKGCWDKIHEK